jgi:glycosyltransferase involved in cell wall biosynthesis
VVALVHHVHREQWSMMFGPRRARLGWWIESRLAPRLYRRTEYVAVSEATRDDLVALGVEAERITVIHNGADPALASMKADGPEPTIVYLGRLVPHKRIELLFDAAAALRDSVPGLRVRVVGRGGWESRLRDAARVRGVADLVTFEGHVDDVAKRRILAEAWVLALPSVQEGWGLVVTEAAAVGTPSVAFRVGGLRESIADGETGLLADTPEEFTAALGAVLADPALRVRLGEAARARAASFDWERTAAAFDELLAGRTSTVDAPALVPDTVGVSAAIAAPGA